jgi:hypothetical protein
VASKPLPIVRRKYLIMVSKPLPRCASQVLGLGAQADARGVAQVLGRGAQVIARSTVQVRDRGTKAVARAAAGVDAAEERKQYRLYLYITKVTLAAMYPQRVRVAGCSCAATPAHVSTAVTPPLPAAENLGVGLRRPCRGISLAGEEQLGRCTAVHRKYYRLYLYSSKVALAAMYLRCARVVGRSFAAALAHVSTVVTPPVPAAENLGVDLWWPCRGRRVAACLRLSRALPPRGPPRRVERPQRRCALVTRHFFLSIFFIREDATHQAQRSHHAKDH